MTTSPVHILSLALQGGFSFKFHVLAAPTCNYYERGTTSPPLYVSNMIKLQETAYTMHWPLLGVHELFFYDMRCIGRELYFIVA